MSFSDFIEDALLDTVFGANSYQPSGTLYVALSRTTPSDDGTGVTEPTAGSGYARVASTNDVTNWPAASGGSKYNGQTISFSQATGSWGTVTYVVVYDDLAAGNMLGYGVLDTPKPVSNGDTASFAASGINITLD